ncbi:transmembrane protein 245 isoform X2 [Frankliniella occidentalis]|uniref:Transmembrane protein 245 isoform X2 n=1 Tax=Frankliniella occidentalis TaxID=133901 RepID=A0A9C6WQN3_FRAOC|nr:transmembrane protein 245 isoform X2 [Frankliniella occidentalis]
MKGMASSRATTLNNVWNFLGGSLGIQGHEKAVKNALYNALAMLLLVVCCAALYALFFILDPFLKPLLWALLLGSVLHPFKYSLVYSVKNWLDVLETRGTPMAVAFVMIPVSAFDRFSDRIGGLLYRNLKLILCLSIALPLLLALYGYTPQACLCLLWRMIYALYAAINFIVSLSSGTMLLTYFCGYVSTLTLWWSPENSNRFSIGAYVLWCLGAGYIARFVGQSYQVIAFILLQSIYCMGYFYEKWCASDSYKSSKERHLSLVEALMKSATSSERTSEIIMPTQSLPVIPTDTIINESTDRSADFKGVNENDEHIPSPSEVDGLSKPRNPLELDNHLKVQAAAAIRPTTLKSAPPENDRITSENCLYVLGWTSLAVFIWNHLWLLHFLPVTIFMYTIKHLGHYFGVWSWLSSQYEILQNSLSTWSSTRKDAICPPFVSGLLKMQTSLRQQILLSLRDSVDSAASVLVILALLVFLLSTTIFITLNVYAEGIHLVQVAGNAINNTLSHNQEILALLPEGVQEKLHLVLDNAYLYGRQSISSMVHAMLKNADADKAELLEQRVLELWDRIYQAWMMTSSELPGAMGPKVSSSAVYASWESFLDGVMKTPELLNLDGLMQFGKENVGMLSSLLESLWDIVRGNVSLLFQSSVTIFSVVLGGGSAVINFLINSVVFFTALFYLLSSSGSLYRPVELVAGFSPSSGNQIATAIDGAVGDVFRASFKMAVFHGLWAWLIHTLFGVKVVYLPSVLAAILGVVPFLGTYWACIPAVLELWLAQGHSMLAVIMILAFYIPTSWVNGLVYEEIKGGHPYLTGLSIAGGVYCMGSEGAIFGPLLLCCVFVALNISSTLMKEPSISHMNPLNMLRLNFDRAST